MKAVYIREHGGAEALTYGDLPDPRVGPNDVLVRVRSCALNRLDVFVRLGVRGTRLALDEPHVLGSDVAGDVLETGSEVSRVRPGDRVVVNPKITCRECSYCLAAEDELCVSPEMMGRTTQGGYAELVSVPAANVVQIPDTLSYEQAAALPTVFMPVWSMLLRRARLRAWETVLVLSASSGVGTAAIQVAKRVVGATVVATTSTDEKVEMASALGADHVIQYTSEDVRRRLKELTGGRGVDVVVDHVGRRAVGGRVPIAGPRRALRHLRGHVGVQGRAADGAAVPDEPDRLRRLHGQEGRPAADRRDGLTRHDTRRRGQDVQPRGRCQRPRGA